MGKGEFFKLIKVIFEKNIFEVQKSEKKTFGWNVDLGQKQKKKIIFQNYTNAPFDVYNFLDTTKGCAKEIPPG